MVYLHVDGGFRGGWGAVGGVDRAYFSAGRILCEFGVCVFWVVLCVVFFMLRVIGVCSVCFFSEFADSCFENRIGS